MKRIVIAEDEESIVTSLEFLMRSCALEARVAREGEEALRLIREFRPHLVLLDIMLPGRSGFEVAHAIRADPRLRGMRILMLTAKGGAHEMSRGLASGADDYLIKPFATRELVERVRDLLREEVPGSVIPDRIDS